MAFQPYFPCRGLMAAAGFKLYVSSCPLTRLLWPMVFAFVLEPRVLMESTEPLTLDNAVEYEDAVSGNCIVEVPEVRNILYAALNLCSCWRWMQEELVNGFT